MRLFAYLIILIGVKIRIVQKRENRSYVSGRQQIVLQGQPQNCRVSKNVSEAGRTRHSLELRKLIIREKAEFIDHK